MVPPGDRSYRLGGLASESMAMCRPCADHDATTLTHRTLVHTSDEYITQDRTNI